MYFQARKHSPVRNTVHLSPGATPHYSGHFLAASTAFHRPGHLPTAPISNLTSTQFLNSSYSHEYNCCGAVETNDLLYLESKHLYPPSPVLTASEL